MKKVTAIGDGKKKKEEVMPLLRAKVKFKSEGEEELFDFHYMGHSMENPMMLTLIKVMGKTDELPVAIINCDSVSHIRVEEIPSDEV